MHKVRNASILIAITLIAVLIFVSFISGVEKTARLSTNSSAAQATGGVSLNSSITYTGNFVVFESAATNLVTDTNAVKDIFKKDVKKGTTTRVSTNSSGTQATGASTNPVISGSTARIVAFESTATDLVTGGTAIKDIYDSQGFDQVDSKGCRWPLYHSTQSRASPKWVRRRNKRSGKMWPASRARRV